MKRELKRLFLAGLLVLAASAAAEGLIKAPLPLDAYVKQTSFILVAKVDKYFPEKPALVLNVVEDLKGKAPYRRLPIAIKLAPNEKNENYIPEIMKRLAEGEEIILFVMERGKQSTVFGFTNGSWFQVNGQKVAEDRREWGLVSGEPFLRRIYKGTTAELKKDLVAFLTDKKKLPDPNEKEKPGFGPEIEKKPAEKSGEKVENIKIRNVDGFTGTEGGGLFAIIPSVGVGVPIAILAVLFPAVFGPVLIVFRQWLAFITVLSINSTLLFLVIEFGLPFRSWWGTEAALWFVMTMVILVGTLWAWRRQMHTIYSPTGITEAPRRPENIALMALSAVFLALMLAYYLYNPPTFRLILVDLLWNVLLTFAFGVWTTCLIRVFQTVAWPDRIPQTRSTEGLILGAMLLTSVCITSARWGGQVETGGDITQGENIALAGSDAPRPSNLAERWKVQTPSSGSLISMPLVHENKVYMALATPNPADWGVLYCMDRASGAILWEFIDDEAPVGLKKCYSSPVMANGKLYFGEGWHDSTNCRVYCIEEVADGDTGKKKPRKVWEHKTTSQTEATPVVVNGKVYIGAGNEGYLCLDADTGKVLWRFDASKIPDGETRFKGKVLRFGSGPAVVGDRVFFATGVDRNFSREECVTRAFCVHADTGEMLWEQETNFACWGNPVAKGDHVYFAVGTGDFTKDAIFEGEQLGGGVLCLYALTGAKAWKFNAPLGVLERPSVDHHHVYVGCRDGYVYCLDRFDGEKVRWQQKMGSVALSCPQIVRSTTSDATASIIAVGAKGKVCCLDPNSGQVQWTFDISSKFPHIGTPRVVVSHTPEGDRRQIFFGATLGGAETLITGDAVVYCLEDIIKAR